MKSSLQFRLSQHLSLTPQLQQSIRLLQLSTLELQQEIEQMLEQNPFLDPDTDDGLDAMPDLDRQRADVLEREVQREAQQETSHDAPSSEPDAAGIDTAELGTSERDDWENGTERDDFDGIRETPSGKDGIDDEGDAFERTRFADSLQDHLRDQLRGMGLPAADAAAVQVLIESLNEDGYLADSLDDIADSLIGPDADEDDADELRSRLRCALHWLQHLDPVGVGARDLPECLVLQLQTQADTPARAVAILICQHHLELLARKDIRKLVVATGSDEALIKQAQALIVKLEPKPGRAFANAEANIIVPDVIVKKSGRNFKAMLNPDVMPKLRINDLYAQALKRSRSDKSAAGQEGYTNMSARLQEARWFVKNIQQRFETILRVSQAIVERQKNFFTHGEIAMKPLVLREIADELGLHESTISRVTTAKYMATPLGTFELKYFFGSSLNTEAGGNASSTAVRALIKQFIAAESPSKPLSDSKLSDMLEEQGIQVARRTVAKYREALKIAPANLRKAL